MSWQVKRQNKIFKSPFWYGWGWIFYKMVQKGESPPDDNLFRGFISALYNTLDVPVTWFRGIVLTILRLLLCKYVTNRMFIMQKKLLNQIRKSIRGTISNTAVYRPSINVIATMLFATLKPICNSSVIG